MVHLGLTVQVQLLYVFQERQEQVEQSLQDLIAGLVSASPPTGSDAFPGISLEPTMEQIGQQ